MPYLRISVCLQKEIATLLYLPSLSHSEESTRTSLFRDRHLQSRSVYSHWMSEHTHRTQSGHCILNLDTPSALLLCVLSYNLLDMPDNCVKVLGKSCSDNV